MAINLPSAIKVGGRFPTDEKYWVASYANINDGEIYEGMPRWTLDTHTLYYLVNGVWIDAFGISGSAGTISIGTVTDGLIASITNVGTASNAILNFILPKGLKGDTPVIDIGSVQSGTTASVTNVGTVDRAILDFVIPKGVDGINGTVGNNAWVAYAQDINGLGATFTVASTTKYIAFYLSINQPSLGAFSNWQKFMGDAGAAGGPAGLSAYQTYVNNGHPNATEQQFLASLNGVNGLSAYQIWLSLGNTGTEQDFINSINTGGVTQVYVDNADTTLRNSITTQSTRITNAINLANSIDTKIGSLNSLTTTNKTDIVSAINEVKSQVGTGGTVYTLPAATSTVRGGITSGSGVTLVGDTLSANSQVTTSLASLSTVLAPSISVIKPYIDSADTAIQAEIGDLSLLFTTNQSSLVNATNEVNAKATPLQVSGTNTARTMSQDAITKAIIEAGAGQQLFGINGSYTANKTYRGYALLFIGNPGEFLISNYATTPLDPGTTFYIIQNGGVAVKIKPSIGSAGTGVTLLGLGTTLDSNGFITTTGVYSTLKVQALGGDKWLISDAYQAPGAGGGGSTPTPIATKTTVGTVKAGNNIAIQTDGTISTEIEIGTGTVLFFDRERDYTPVTSGTYSLNITGKKVGVFVRAYVEPGGTAISFNANINDFQKLGTGSFVAGVENIYVFSVANNGNILYLITQPQN